MGELQFESEEKYKPRVMLELVIVTDPVEGDPKTWFAGEVTP
jgi:hypothetical protein